MVNLRGMGHIFGPGAHAFYSDLPKAESGARRYWGAYPADELAYENFTRWALALAGSDQTQIQPEESQSLGTVPEHNRFTNGLVDWSSSSETTPVLRGKVAGGWIDPDCATVGGMSWVRNDTRRVLTSEPALVNLERREWSFITLDTSTWIRDASRKDMGIYPRLIKPSAELGGCWVIEPLADREFQSTERKVVCAISII